MPNRQEAAQLGVAVPILREQQETGPITDRHLCTDEQLHAQCVRLYMRADDAVHAVPIGERQTAQAQPLGFVDQGVRRTGPFQE
jgi:hypothetical protein